MDETTELSERDRLLIHDAVSTTVDTIVASIQNEIGHAERDNAHAKVIEGLRRAEGAAATASIAARSAAIHGGRNSDRLEQVA